MLTNVIDLILETYDLSLNNEERRKKIEFINNYQENIFTLDDLKIFLSSNSKEEIKIFGFKCLENFILYKWNTAEKNVAKTYLIEIIKEYGSFMVDVGAERVVRWIIAKTVMYFIRNECPQNCDTIITDLINLKDNGIMTKALILSIFYCLSESLPNDCQMPDKRKKEVIFFITEQANKMISFSIDVVQENAANSNNLLNLTLEAMKTIQSLCSWIKFETIMSFLERLLPVVLTSLMVDSSDYYLLDVLETILVRKVKSEETYKVLMVIVNNDQLWQTFVTNISTGLHLSITPYSDDKFRYLQKLFDLLLVIGNLVISNWLHFSKDVTGNVVSELFELFLIATHHPIKLLSVEFLSFWYNGFKNEQEGLRNVLVSKAQTLLPLLKFLSIKQNVRDSSNVDNEYLINLIEESDADAYIARIRIEVSKTTNILTQYFTQDIISLALEWVLSVVNAVEEMEVQSTDFLKHIQHSSLLMKELEASRFFIRCVMHTVLKPYSKTLKEAIENLFSVSPLNIIEKGNVIITKILVSQDLNMSVSNIYLDYLCLLIPFAIGREDKIEQCLEKIFKWYGKGDLVETSSFDPGTLKQLQMDCGVWLLRVFRDYNFIIPSYMFERILNYHQSTCSPLYSRPNMIEAFTVYICHSGNYTVQQKQTLLGQFVDSIKTVICSNQLLQVFENCDSLIFYFQMERLKPTDDQGPNYPSLELTNFKFNLNMAISALLGICRRLAIDHGETESGPDHAKATETASIISCSMTDAILPMLPSLFVMLRCINQIWSSRHVHSDFKSLTEISEHFRDSLVKTHTNTEKLLINSQKSFGDNYVANCRNFLSRLTESVWTILAKCCFNFGHDLYCLREWSLGVIDYVFADLGSLPNFKLMGLIKTFLIPFVCHCPPQLVKEVLIPTVVPFINYLFQIIGEHWKLIQGTNSADPCSAEYDMDNESNDNTDLTKEIIEEQVLRVLSKTFVNLFRLTMTLGCVSVDDSVKSVIKLGIISEFLFSTNTNEDFPMILVFLNHICLSLTWRDSFCCNRLCSLIQPFVREIHKHGLLTADIIIFIVKQSIRALNIFTGYSNADIRLCVINLGLYLYEEYLSKDASGMERFLGLFDKSSSKDIHTFQHKMMLNTSSKVKREAFTNLLQPYVGVPVNEMFTQEVCIKNLPPLLKPEWKSRKQHRVLLEGEEPLCLANLFD